LRNFLRRSIVRGYIDLLTGTLTHLGWSKYQDDLTKKIKVYKKAVDIIELMWEDGDYGFYIVEKVDKRLRK
jgi:hypothetical protein